MTNQRPVTLRLSVLEAAGLQDLADAGVRGLGTPPAGGARPLDERRRMAAALSALSRLTSLNAEISETAG